MNFEVLGPYFLKTPTIIKTRDVVALWKELEADETVASQLSGPGCYVFGVKSSGAPRVKPWYVGKAERQSVFSEATNGSHLQLYNEILDNFSRAHPALFFIPAVTPKGRTVKPSAGKAGKPAVEFLESWLISTALKQNPDLWNIKKTKMLRDLHVRGIFNPKPGETTTASGALRRCLGL